MTDPNPNLVILYVENPPKSAAFYARLLSCEPIDTSATFAMVPLAAGMALGLWSRATVVPPASAPAGAAELAFTTTNVDAVHADWVEKGLFVAQPPTDLDFGRAFVALDPDGHRLRVFAPTAR